MACLHCRMVQHCSCIVSLTYHIFASGFPLPSHNNFVKREAILVILLLLISMGCLAVWPPDSMNNAVLRFIKRPRACVEDGAGHFEYVMC